MAKMGRASTPVDLMSYEPEDEEPSIFLLRESPRQTILTVFNWTRSSRSHTLKIADLELPPGHSFAASDVLNQNTAVPLLAGSLQIANQTPESVRVIKIIDNSVAPAASAVTANVPSVANAGEIFPLSAQPDASGVPAVSYVWDFGDGISARGAKVSHTYTRAGTFNVR